MKYLINDSIILIQAWLVGTHKKQVWDGGSYQGGFFPLTEFYSLARMQHKENCDVEWYIDPKDCKAVKPPVTIHLHVKQSQNQLV